MLLRALSVLSRSCYIYSSSVWQHRRCMFPMIASGRQCRTWGNCKRERVSLGLPITGGRGFQQTPLWGVGDVEYFENSFFLVVSTGLILIQLQKNSLNCVTMDDVIKLYAVFTKLNTLTIDVLTGHFPTTIFLSHSIIKFWEL